MSDLEIAEPGFILVFRNFDLFAKDDGHALLDVLANNSRRNLLFGRRFITLVQVNDPDYTLDPVGGCDLMWNRAEWVDAKRKSPLP